MRPIPSFRALKRHRPIAVATAALALVVVTVPLLPDGDGPDGALTPTGEQTSAPAPGAVTAEMRTEIERVVAAGRDVTPSSDRASMARALARCATFEGERYCLGIGWTTLTEAEVAEQLAVPVVRTGRERTGDLDAQTLLGRAARLTPAARAEAERAELTAAARSVAKVRLLRRQVQGGGKQLSDYPDKVKILRSTYSRAQNEYYWCGPATMQAIAWANTKERKHQSYWARRLNTTTAGTAITDMVRVINRQTTYDNKDRAGRYVVLDISDFTFTEWKLLIMRHIHDYRAPLVLHPVLLKRYYPYLDDDASGHFQVGRGFDQNPGGKARVGYFEPWDQSKFDPTEPYVERVQWRNAYKSFRANKAHFQHNLGV